LCQKQLDLALLLQNSPEISTEFENFTRPLAFNVV